MFCPSCSQELISRETKYCSRCGFLMTGVIDLIDNRGGSKKETVLDRVFGDSPRQKGIKQGLFIFLLSFLVVPIITIITVADDAEPYAVILAAMLLVMGGILRMVYAFLFQSNQRKEDSHQVNFAAHAQRSIHENQTGKSLPEATSEPVSDFVPPAESNWRDTNDLVPRSVTEETTNLLEKKISS